MFADLAPIVLFVYNRPEHTRRTVEALHANRLAAQSRLIVFSDGPKDDKARPAVEAVRHYINTIDGFASLEVVERETNQGLAASVIAGVTQVVERCGRVVVLEDDLLTSPHFLDYMNEGLELYENDEDVASVQAHMFPLRATGLPQSFFLPLTGSWGWGVWRRSWRLFNPDGEYLLREIRRRGLVRQFDLGGAYPYFRLLEQQVAGEVNSWAIRWYASIFLMDKKSLFPSVSFVANIGFDGSGVHCGNVDLGLMSAVVAQSHSSLARVPVKVDDKIGAAFQAALTRTSWRGRVKHGLMRIRRILSRFWTG